MNHDNDRSFTDFPVMECVIALGMVLIVGTLFIEKCAGVQ